MTIGEAKTETALVAPQPGAPLLKIEEVRRLLAECVRVDEVKDIRDKAQAIAAYYRERDASLEVQNDAAEVRLRAERRLGALLEPIAKDAQRKRSAEAADHPALAEIGITHKQSSVWQRIAKIADDEFESRIAEAKENGLELTTSRVLRGPPPTEMHDEPMPTRGDKKEKDWNVTLTLTLPHSALPAVTRVLQKLGFTGGGNQRKMKLRTLNAA